MPDADKMRVLRLAGYKILRACGRCSRFTPGTVDPQWGTCAAIRYDHAKHGNRREASVHALGACEDDFRADLRRLAIFGAHAEFLEGV